MAILWRLSLFQILIFILTFNIEFSLAQAQDSPECLEVTQSQTPSEIIDIASNIIVGYRSTGTFKPVVILNSHNLTSASSPIELQYSEHDLVSRYTVVELSPDHQKILQIFSDDTNDLLLRVSGVAEDNIVSTEIGGIRDTSVAPRWLNSQAILIGTNRSEASIYSYTTLSLENMAIDSISVDLNSQPIPLTHPQLSPDLSHLVFWGRENGARRIYVFSNTILVSTSVFDEATSVIDLQWSPQGNYIDFFSGFNDSLLPQHATVISRDGELIFTRELSYGDPVAFPRNTEIVWSPDERFIAYQNQTTTFRGQTGLRTSIIEIESQKVLDICIPGNLFWSPDSQYGAIFLRTPSSSSPPNEVIGLFVIDINSQEIYEIPIDNMDDIGLEVGWFDLMLDA